MTSYHKVYAVIWIVFVLTLATVFTGCKSWYHIKYLYVVDTAHNVCSQREITNQDTLASKRVADLPLVECDGNISVTGEDFVKLRENLKNSK